MSNTHKIATIVIFCLFLISGALSWQIYFKEYSQQDTVSIHEFPMQIGLWNGVDIPVGQEAKDILETDNMFVRNYTHAQTGEEVMLFIVYSQTNRKVSHPPEICYTGSGATILESSKDVIPIDEKTEIPVNHLYADIGKNTQTILYWFKVGNEFTNNYWKQQILIALKSFRHQSASSALVRLSSNVFGDKRKDAVSAVKTFGKAIEPLLKKYLP